MILKTALEGYWLDKEVNLADETIKRYARVFDRFVDFVGEDEQVEDIDSQDIKGFLRHLSKNTELSKRSIRDCYFVLSSFFSWVEIELEVEHIIKGKVDTPRFTEKKIQPVPMPDVKKIVKACDHNAARAKRRTAKRDKAIIITLVDSGLRVGELCDLRVRDYESSRGRIHVRHGKGDKERFVFVGNRCRKAIWLYLASRRDPHKSEYLFCAKNGNQLNRSGIRNILNMAADRAGVERCWPHKLRHTFAIEFLRAGGNPFELKEILGHERLDMVLHYAQLAEADIEKAARRSSPADKYKL